MKQTCRSKFVNWWLAGVALLVGLVFYPKVLGQWWGPMNAICRSVNAVGVVILLGGGGDTSTLHHVIRVVSTFYNLGWWGHKNLVYTSHLPLHNLHLASHPSKWFQLFLTYGGGDTETQLHCPHTHCTCPYTYPYNPCPLAALVPLHPIQG